MRREAVVDSEKVCLCASQCGETLTEYRDHPKFQTTGRSLAVGFQSSWFRQHPKVPLNSVCYT